MLPRTERSRVVFCHLERLEEGATPKWGGRRGLTGYEVASVANED